MKKGLSGNGKEIHTCHSSSRNVSRGSQGLGLSKIHNCFPPSESAGEQS
jgi:hypothetical protein